MKLTHLLAQYLYKNKRLDLQGIGSFSLDSAIIIEPDNNKQSKETDIEGLYFENNSTLKEDPELVSFISKYSGKIIALASADLNSHLELAKQFMNIGKPFLFEGIGSLSMVKPGEYAFSPGTIIHEKLTEQKTKDSNSISSYEEPVSDYKSTIYKTNSGTNWKNPVIFLLVIIGIFLAIWGGYTVYKRTSINKNEDKIPAASKDIPILLEDSLVSNLDTIKNAVTSLINKESGFTKFVLETSAKDRVIQRYNQLKTFQWDVKMETQDSILFKLFLLIPASSADTPRILDSLTKLNGRKVVIEK